MPIPKAAHARPEQQDHVTKSLLNFLNNLPSRLTHLPNDITLADELKGNINALRINSAVTIGSAKPEDIDRKGTDLWNLGSRLGRDGEARPGPAGSCSHVLVLVRVFAFMLLDCANQVRRRGALAKWKHDVRLLRVANRAARSALEGKEDLELCMKVLERAAEYEKAVGEGLMSVEVKEQQVDEGVLAQLRVEYFGLRMVLAWKQDRLDLIEFWFHRIGEVHISAADQDYALQPAAAEMIADLLFEVGKDLLRKAQPIHAVKWLERSLELLTNHELERLSNDAGELKLTVTQHLVRALLALETDEGRTKARDLLILLKNDYGDRMVVLLLKLELLLTEEDFNDAQYYTVLLRMMRSVHMTQANFKTIMSQVLRLKDYSPSNACKALDELLMLCLQSDSKEEWTQKVLVTRIWISTDKLAHETGVLDALQQTVAGLWAKLAKPLAAPATHAGQVLLWKRINSEYEQGKYNIAEAWARLSQHQLFANGGELNAARISRKIILCAMARHDFATARADFNQMPEAVRAAPMTRHLMYKVALRDHDVELAAESLDIISRNASKDATLLYACVLEAQSSGEKRQAIIALQRVLTRFDYSAPAGVHLPALLRCTARMLMSELAFSSGQETEMDISAQVCDLFQGATQAGKKAHAQDLRAVELFNDQELDWFIKNSYNTAVKYYGEWPAEHTVGLLEACITFMDHLRNFSKSGAAKLGLQSRICYALAAQSLVKLARGEDHKELKLQCYLRAREYLKRFNSEHDDDQGKASMPEDAIQMARRLVKTDFEAAIHLRMWDDLTSIVDQSKRFGNQELYQALADMVLAADAPSAKILETIERIISATAMTQHAAIATLARWLRVGYTLSLIPSSSAPNTTTITTTDIDVDLDTSDRTDAILAQALDLAQSANSPEQSNRYPPEELEYLASHTFNRAIDAYCAADEATCQRLAETALKFAGALKREDGGALTRVLVARLAGLRWADAGS